jgi:hypothetical protein
VHFSSWDSHKDWSIPFPNKEYAVAVTIGNGWIAVATSRRFLRVFTIGGVQCDVISVPGHVVTMAAWGSRLSVVYQVPPCKFKVWGGSRSEERVRRGEEGLLISDCTGTSNVYSLWIWVLDIQRKKQLHPPHIMPLSHHSELSWIG